MSRIKKLLERISKEKAPGPAPTFSVLHVLKSLELIAERSIGRTKLAEELRIGQGATRTIINRLKATGLISTSRIGCTLTEKGRKIWEEYKKTFLKKAEVKDFKLIDAKYNFAILAKNCGHKIRSGVEQRDSAVKVGARGAVTLVYKDGRLTVPSVDINFAGDFPKTAECIIKVFQPEENDVIIVSGADSIDLAEYGATAAAWTLFDDC
jgi:DNA-binding MarR family transcriptional regulator